MKNTLKVSLLALAVTSAFYSQANDVRVNGFANIVAGATTSNDEVFLGYDSDLNYSQGSLFGLQVSGDINEKMTATGQIVARGTEDYNAEFEWAYITYHATPELSVSAGRFRLPLFNYSSSSDVGYSYHWVEAPSTVYDVPFTNLDGIKADYSNTLGNWDYLLTAGTGTYKGTSLSADNTGKDVVLFSSELSNEWLKLRGVYGSANTTVNLSESTDAEALALSGGLSALDQFGFTELSSGLAIEDDSGVFMGFSAQVDVFNWFIGGEYTSIQVEDSFLADDDALYVTAGLRLDKWAPSITIEQFKSEVDFKFLNEVSSINASQLPADVIAQLSGVALGSQLSQEEDYQIVTLGVRYDMMTNVALKAEVSKMTDDVNKENDATMVKLAVSFIF